MANKKTDYWAGGDWEHPDTHYSIPRLPNANLTDHVRRSQNFRGARRKMGRILRFFCAATLSVCLMAVIFDVIDTYNQMSTPSSGGGTSAPPSGSSGSGGSGSWGWGDIIQEETTDTTMVEPTLPQAELLTENLLEICTDDSDPLTPQEIYANIQPSVVYIEALTEDGIAAGTGIIVSEDGYIITNAHIVSGAVDAYVILWDETMLPVTLVGWNRDEDLAVLKVEADNLVPATIGDSSALVVGDTAYAIGNPLGEEYRSTFTDGMISAVDRYLDIDGVYMSLIQTTTPINSGNSGGALLNDRGEVVGITTIKLASDSDSIENMGFAIPSSRVVQVVNCLVQGIEVETPALGVTVYQIYDPVRGLMIESVTEGSFGDQAGLQAGDILTHAQGIPLYSSADLVRIKGELLVGDTLTVTVLRGEETFDVDVVLGNYNEIYATD